VSLAGSDPDNPSSDPIRLTGLAVEDGGRWRFGSFTGPYRRADPPARLIHPTTGPGCTASRRMGVRCDIE